MFDIKEEEYCKLLVNVTADQDMVQEKKNDIINLFKNANIPGFRKGKAPSDVIRMHFRKQIDETLLSELKVHVYNKFVNEHNVNVFGHPVFETSKVDENKFHCKFSVYKKPDFELGEYKNFDIIKPHLNTSADEAAAGKLESLRKQHGEHLLLKSEDSLQDGDQLVLNCTCTVDGNAFDRLTLNNEFITLGTTPIVGFDDQLVGMSVGQSKMFGCTLPEVNDKDVSGKLAEFNVSVVAATRTVPCGLDDELAKKAGEENYESLRNKVYSECSNEIQKMLNSEITERVIRKLVENHNFTVPMFLSTLEAQTLCKSSGKNWDNLTEDEKNYFTKAAENNVKLSLVLEKIQEKESESQLTDQEAMSILRQNYSAHKHNENLMSELKRFLDGGGLPFLMNSIKQEHVIQFVVKSCNVVE